MMSSRNGYLHALKVSMLAFDWYLMREMEHSDGEEMEHSDGEEMGLTECKHFIL